MYRIEDDGRQGYSSFKAIVEVGPSLIVAYGPNRAAALTELRIHLRNIQNEIEVCLSELKGAE